MDQERSEISFRHLEMPADLACEFLAVFSRLEYALKAAKYAHGDATRVEAAWDTFANSVNDAFTSIPDRDLQDAVSLLLGAPPRKQVIRDGLVKFVEQVIDRKQSDAQQTLLMVRTVRNNLFHGGKYLPHGEIEVGRNESLVRASLIVLNHCVSLDDAVNDAFQR
ncbi:hypothetical protein [Candidatus Rariloculus sp.]|uniref:hypothetical protein n=1 Tax=Candidatus Rariloculus sp. TaxID=3101265 RepID=UPI003D0AA6FD